MISWKNLDTLTSYKTLCALKNKVDLTRAMAGEEGAARVAGYHAPMAAGLTYYSAA